MIRTCNVYLFTCYHGVAMIMGDFKDSKTLYDEQKEKRKITRWESPSVPSSYGVKRRKEVNSSICEFFTLEGCEASIEAVKLELAKTVFLCQGSIPPYCPIHKKLIAGATIQELYQK